jgi:hypothetical protein
MAEVIVPVDLTLFLGPHGPIPDLRQILDKCALDKIIGRIKL